ncbi:MAG: Ig-like domain-containing protein, partial [Ferruginibacter sp.]
MKIIVLACMLLGYGEFLTAHPLTEPFFSPGIITCDRPLGSSPEPDSLSVLAPINDDPCNAITLTVGATCNYATYNNASATPSTGVSTPLCGSYAGADVWFQVVVPAGGSIVVNSQNSGGIADGAMAIYTGTCNALTEIACNDDNLGLMPSISTGGLTPGSTIWIRFWAYSGAVEGIFDLCVTTPPPPPANDNPCNATSLTVGSTCNFTTHTNAAALPTSTIPAPSCGFYNNAGDVWFTVTVPAGGALVFDTEAGSMLNAEMAIYSGTCGILTEIACNADGPFNAPMSTITAGGLVPGSTIWIRVWDYGGYGPGSFGICVSPPPPPPANDNPCTATPLTVNSTCTYSNYNTAGATATVPVPDPGCGFYSGADVWFTVTVPTGGGIFLNSQPGTLLDGAMAVYSGTSCNNLTLIRCDDNSSGNINMPQISIAGLTAGTTLWIRFWGYGGYYGGSFGICASVPPPPTEQDCPAAIPICQNVYSTTISYSGTGNILNEIDNSTSCLASGEKNDVWYTFTVQTSGDLNFTITPYNLPEDYDWAVYNLTNATCADIFSNSAIDVSCNFSADGGDTGPTGATTLTNQSASGNPFNDVIPVIAGETYVINVSNYSSSTNGYTIDFSASTASIFDNVPPVFQSIGAASTCGGSELVVNFSENILCSTVQNADFLVTGPGGPYTVTGWSSASCSSGATYGNNLTLTLSPAITTNGAFQVCLTNAAGSVTDLCGNVAVPACYNFNIATTVPAFNQVGPICGPGPAIILPTTSLNGVSGTWAPPVVSTSTSGTYTFTPAAGQCAVPVTMTVTVGSGITPAFNPIPPICSGSVAPVLQSTSTNGIAGTWSPPTVSNSSSGVYTFTPGAGQCAISTTLAVTVNSTLTSSSSVVVCNNQLPYSWNGNSYPAAGTYSVTLTSSAGCDSIATLNLTVNSSV